MPRLDQGVDYWKPGRVFQKLRKDAAPALEISRYRSNPCSHHALTLFIRSDLLRGSRLMRLETANGVAGRAIKTSRTVIAYNRRRSL